MAEQRRAAVTGMELGGAIAKALGLVSTTHITIDIPLEGAVKVTVTYFPTPDEVREIPDILRQYRLFPQTPEDLASERDRLRDAKKVFEEYGVSVTPQFQAILRRLMEEGR